MTHAYYNEFDAKAAACLREFIKAGLIAPGDVDERSITDVRADDLRGYDQCHFFAGFGFWSYALRLAGWPDYRPVWTGSCPCQPFSCAGKQLGTADERHLWPTFARLIAECRPTRIFGEQVASSAVVGKVGRRVAGSALAVWIDGVRADLEAAGYTCGHTVLGAHSVGAPHIRQRLYWLADRLDARLEGHAGSGISDGRGDGSASGISRQGARHEGHTGEPVNASRDRVWSSSVWWPCLDGKLRRVPATEQGTVKPGLFPLADAGEHRGYRVPALRGAGNAIVPALAAEFIQACEECLA